MNLSGRLAAVVLATLTASQSGWAAEPTKAQCADANEAAQKLRKSHKLKDARAQLLVCVSSSCPSAVRDDCVQLLGDVEKALPTVVFVVTSSDGRDLTAVKVTVDGAPFADRLDGSALAVDPGAHAFAFESPGFGRVESSLLVHEGDKQRRERVVLRAPNAAAAPIPSQRSTPAVAYVALGLGAAGVAVGSVFGVLAFGKRSSLDSACVPSKTTCPGSSKGDIDALHTDSLVSTVAFVAGAAGIATGLLVFALSGGKKEEETASDKVSGLELAPWISPSSLGVSGSFE